MNKLLFLTLSFFIVGCNNNVSLINQSKNNFETISFDVVEKQLKIDTDLPQHLQILVNGWFNQKVKINGFDGDLKFSILGYTQEVSSIDEGKRVDLSMSFTALLSKSTQNQIKLIEGEISSFGTLTGDFSLSEFETLIENTQIDLILRLSQDLKSKI